MALPALLTIRIEFVQDWSVVLQIVARLRPRLFSAVLEHPGRSPIATGLILVFASTFHSRFVCSAIKKYQIIN